MSELTEQQQELLRQLVRVQIRKIERGRLSLRVKFGRQYDDTHMNSRLAFLESTYRALGGDPTQITNRRTQETSDE